MWKNIFDTKDEGALPKVQTNEDYDAEKIGVEVMASLPSTPPKETFEQKSIDLNTVQPSSEVKTISPLPSPIPKFIEQ